MIFESNGKKVVTPGLSPTTQETRNIIDSYDAANQRYLALRARHDQIRREFEEMPPAVTLTERVDRLFAMHDAIDHATMSGILHLVSGASAEERKIASSHATEEVAGMTETSQTVVDEAQTAINGVAATAEAVIPTNMNHVGHTAVNTELEVAGLLEGAPVSTGTMRVSAPQAFSAAQA